jgi:DNA-cytosine methyltransferase
MLKVLDLFSGIGGFSLGLESTGHFETIAFCEKDQFCQKVLQKNFKNIPIEGDVRNVKGDKYKADVVTGGFPCQPFSVAGKRKGTDDDRYLWDETIRVVRECKPKWFIGENVEGLINIQEGLVLRQVQTDLEKEGFEVQCLIIPASGIGAWHQRKRVWIIGCNVSNSNKSRSFKEYSSTINRQNKRNGFINESGIRSNENVSNSKSKWSRECRNINKKERLEESKSTQSDCICSDVPNTFGKLSNGCSSSTRNSSKEFKGLECNKSWNWNEVRSKTERCSKQDRKDVSDSNGKRSQGHKFQQHLETRKQSSTNDGKESFKRQQTWWQTQSELCGVPNGVSYELDKDRANRVKSLGNSIVPQIARELGKAIIAAENEE